MAKVSNFKIQNSGAFDVSVNPQSGSQFFLSDGSTSAPQMVYTKYTARSSEGTVLFEIVFTADGDLNVTHRSGAGGSFVVSGQLN